jgi:glycosyltransferase involved in cell wall biosynthesis
MLRILLATYAYPPSVGGVERHSQSLARALVRRGHRVHVVTTAVEGQPAHERDDAGVEITRVLAGAGTRYRKMYMYVGAMSLAALRGRDEIDLIHSQQALYPSAAMTLVARAIRKPIVVRNSGSGEHGAVQLMGRLPLGPVSLRAIGRLATTVSLSPEMTGEMHGAGFREVHEIPNGVVLPSRADLAGARRALKISESAPVVVYVGRLCQEKGTSTLAAAWPRVTTRGAQLIVAGDGPDRHMLDAIPGVRIDGFVGDVSPYYAAADVFVLPSESEGISNALLEAMAYGLPVIATAVGGNRQVIANDRVGMLVPPMDPAALASALDGLLRDPERTHQMGDAAREHVRARWSFDAMVDAYERLYSSLARGAHGSRRSGLTTATNS